jgi:multiple antibiotic resistance protein
MFIAIDILFEKRKIRREKKVEAAIDEKNFDEIIVFPMAIPFIAGPSTLATIILLMGNYSNSIESQMIVVFALVAALIVSLFLMIGTNFSTKFIPPQILHATSRVFAFILAALATQFIIDGIKASFNI